MLEPHESLYIDRWRKSLQQREYARRRNVSGDWYRKIESGREPVPANWVIPEIKDLRPIERYLVLRRRARLTREQLAEVIGIACHHLDLEETEQRHPSHLARYWGDQSV